MIREKAPAKLNLCLDVLGRRDDGYHDMQMIMQTVTLFDELEMEESETPGIRAHTDLSYIPSDERNLAVRAARLFLDETGETMKGLKIRIRKSIPVGAGMAGGSSDAAAVLRGLNLLCGTGLSPDDLRELAAKVGSDVAFCVEGGTTLAEGRGEILSPLPPMPDCPMLLCKPVFSISTPELFRALDQTRFLRHPDVAGMKAALVEGSRREIAVRLYNVFEEIEDRRLQRIAGIKSVMLDYGAEGAVMTGTGSTVFGIFPTEEKAEAAQASLSEHYAFCRMVRPLAM